MARQWTRASDIVWEELDEEAVLVSPAASGTWVLNATASFVWRCCDGRTSPDEIARRLAAAGCRTLHEIRADVERFCEELERIGLICVTGQPPRQFALAGAPLARLASGYAPPRILLHTLGLGFGRKPTPRGTSGPPF